MNVLIGEISATAKGSPHRRRSRSGWSGFGWTTFFKVKINFHFCKKQVINRSASVIFRFVRLIVLLYNR